MYSPFLQSWQPNSLSRRSREFRSADEPAYEVVHERDVDLSAGIHHESLCPFHEDPRHTERVDHHEGGNRALRFNHVQQPGEDVVIAAVVRLDVAEFGQ